MDGGVIETSLVLRRILSFLTTKEAAKTSLLSKAWLDAWRTRPTLEFDEKLFRTKKKLADDLSAQDPEQKGVGRFSHHLRTTMQRYSDGKIRIDTLKLKLVSRVVSKSVIRESIRIAIENNVKTLDLRMSWSDKYDLGQIVFRGKSIVNLDLCACNLRTLSAHQIGCRNIKTLNFYMVSMDELMFENIIRGCPLLQFLEVGRIGGRVDGGGMGGEDEDSTDGEGNGNGNGFHVFRIKKHANLRKLFVDFLKHQSLILGKLPRLELLDCSTDRQLQDVVDWMPSSFSLHSSRYQNMKSLWLLAVGIGDNFFDNFAHLFPNVEDLSLECCPNLSIVNLSSQSMKRIKLTGNEGLKEAHFGVPKMVHFEYSDWGGGGGIPLLSFTPVSGAWESFLNICWRNEVDNLWFFKLKELLSCLVQSEISLTLKIPEIPTFNTDEIRDMFVSSHPLMVDELSLSFSYKEESTVSILDGLFRIFRPKILRQRLARISSMELLHNILVLKRNHDQISFWQSDLKDVQVGTYSKGGFRNRFRQRKTYKLLEMGDIVKDWPGILDVATSIVGVRGICFKFEWATSESISIQI